MTLVPYNLGGKEKPRYTPYQPTSQVDYGQQQKATEAAVLTSTRTQEDDKIDQLDFVFDGYNEDEKDFLKKLSRDERVTVDEFNEAIATMGGNHPIQDGDQSYYLDVNSKGVNMPIPVPTNQRPPKGKEIESVWGSQKSANDDSIYTTIAKNIANTANSIIMSGEDLVHLPYGLATGKEADWYKNAKNRYDARKPKTSEASQESMLNTENIHTYSDIFKPENWHFTLDNIAGTGSQVASSILEFFAGGAIAKGIGLGGKAIANVAKYEDEVRTAVKAGTELPQALGMGTKIMSKAPAFAAGYTINLGEALDAADQAGVQGRDKYAIASLVTIPVSMIEMQLGIESKILNNGAWSGEKKKLIQNLVKGAVKDADGKITAEALEGAYKATTVEASSILGRIAKEASRDMAGEASQEVLQNMTQKASQQIYDALYGIDKVVGEGRYGKEVISPESIAEYINDAIGGAFGGGMGSAGYHAIKKAKAEVQSESAYHAIKQGPEAVNELKVNLAGAYKAGQITADQYELGRFKIDTYQEYYDATKDANLNDADRRKVFDMTWSNKNIETQIEELEKRIGEKGDPDGLVAQQIEVKKSLISANKKFADDLMKKADAGQQTAVAPGVEPKPEKKSSVVKSAPKPKEETVKKPVEKEPEVKKPFTIKAKSKEEPLIDTSIIKNPKIEKKARVTLDYANKQYNGVITSVYGPKEEPVFDVKLDNGTILNGMSKKDLHVPEEPIKKSELDLKREAIETERQKDLNSIPDASIRGRNGTELYFREKEKKEKSINDYYDKKIQELTQPVQKIDKPIQKKEETVQKKKTSVKKKEKSIPIELTDEVKDEPVFEGNGNDLVTSMQKRKSKKTVTGKILLRDGKTVPDLPSVEVDGKIYEMASKNRVMQTLKEQGMNIKDIDAANIAIRHDKAEDWNPGGKIIDSLGNPYGDRIVVVGKNKEGKEFDLGTVKVTDYAEVSKKRKEQNEKKIEPETKPSLKFTASKPVDITNLSDEEIKKDPSFADFKKKNAKLSEEKVLEYYKKCKG